MFMRSIQTSARPAICAASCALMLSLGTSCTSTPEAAPRQATAAAHCTLDAEKFEKDRQAILAMAGDYRVKFQFEETVALKPGYEFHEPHTSSATEFVEVIEDRGDFISLQHVLVFKPQENNDDPDAPGMVVKHWRQDWTYQDTTIERFVGHNTWAVDHLKPEAVRGTWSQAVYQVDDSPRYESYAKWVHNNNFSWWESPETWRPLPRREHSKRSDYHVIVGRNRHILTPAGWVHEQDNYKLILGEKPGEAAAIEYPILAREIGLNLYEKIEGHDFTAGHQYWKETSAFWAEVRRQWGEIANSASEYTIARRVDGKPLWSHMFAYARQINRSEDGYDADAGKAFVSETLGKFVTVR